MNGQEQIAIHTSALTVAVKFRNRLGTNEFLGLGNRDRVYAIPLDHWRSATGDESCPDTVLWRRILK